MTLASSNPAGTPAPVAVSKPAEAPPLNAMTVDVEDYFQVSAFASRVDRNAWDSYPHRIERNTERVLELFARHDVTATFFTLGWVAEHYPALVRRIADAGHEIASHGMQHIRVRDQDPETFRTDIVKARALLEDAAGQPVRGYRAASFSIGVDTPWAFDVLAAAGYAYSSSIYPIRHDHYGVPDAPRFAYQPMPDRSFTELPVTTTRVGARNIPCGGGGYFRLLPYTLSSWAMRRVHRLDGKGCIFYFHPWEIDPEQPRMADLPARTRLRHYTNLDRMAAKLGRLLQEFRWDRLDRVYPVAEG